MFVKTVWTLVPVALSVALVSPQQSGNQSPAYTFSVKHDHFLRSGRGQLSVDEEGITFQADRKGGHSHRWQYTDLQQVKIDSTVSIEIVTYRDTWWQLNRDQRFRFALTNQEITPALVGFLRLRLPPATLASAVFEDPAGAPLSIPAKHRHGLGGGCDGQLIISQEGVGYRSENVKHQRFWPMDEIRSLGRQSAFEFRVTVRERNLLGQVRNFQFQLKSAMDEDVYEQLWRQIHEPESWLKQAAPPPSGVSSPW